MYEQVINLPNFFVFSKNQIRHNRLH
ncbi:MAG: hypothetical protein PWQ06_2124, partial [Anaerophaga sp.]|nr:hypothetical protein [Anaerophaga sp.]